jgi:hypothetical protein
MQQGEVMITPEQIKSAEEKYGIKVPARGEPILARHKDGGNVFSGTVGTVGMSFISLGMEIFIEIETASGTNTVIFPALGDKFKIWES